MHVCTYLYTQHGHKHAHTDTHTIFARKHMNIFAWQETYEKVRVSLNLSHPVALALLAVATAIVGSILGLVMSLILPDKARPEAPKRD